MPKTDQYALAIDGEFRKRVRASIVMTALQIQSEQVSQFTIIDHKRASLASQVLIDGGSNKLDAFSFAIASYNDGIITAQSLDGDIDFVTAAIWNDLAGVVSADKG